MLGKALELSIGQITLSSKEHGNKASKCMALMSGQMAMSIQGNGEGGKWTEKEHSKLIKLAKYWVGRLSNQNYMGIHAKDDSRTETSTRDNGRMVN